MSNIPKTKLNGWEAIPQLGFDLWKVDYGAAESVIPNALKAVYRALDGAAIYRNEGGLPHR